MRMGMGMRMEWEWEYEWKAMNIPEYSYLVFLPAAAPSPPPYSPYSPVESPLASPREVEPVLDMAEEIEK